MTAAWWQAGGALRRSVLPGHSGAHSRRKSGMYSRQPTCCRLCLMDGWTGRCEDHPPAAAHQGEIDSESAAWCGCTVLPSANHWHRQTTAQSTAGTCWRTPLAPDPRVAAAAPSCHSCSSAAIVSCFQGSEAHRNSQVISHEPLLPCPFLPYPPALSFAPSFYLSNIASTLMERTGQCAG